MIKKCISVTSHALYPPPPARVTYFMGGPSSNCPKSLNCNTTYIVTDTTYLNKRISQFTSSVHHWQIPSRYNSNL